MHAAVVGAGLAGLTAAYRLSNAGWEVDVLESEPEVGGRTRTRRRDGYQFDIGATGLAASYTGYFALADELGVTTEPCSPVVGIYRDGTIHHLRLDRMVRSGLRTRLLSPRAKLRSARLLRDVVPAVRRGQIDYTEMSRAAPLDTETARAYAMRRLGDELDAYLVDPITRMTLIADSGKASKVELFFGVASIFSSLISATVGGQGRLAEALAEPLTVELGREVGEVVEHPDGVEVDDVRYDAAVVTCPLPIARRICPGEAALLGPLDDAIDYTQSLVVSVGTTRAPASEAFVVQQSSRDDPDVALMFLEHNKGPGRAPAGHGLFGCCWETDAASAWLGRSDEEIVAHTVASIERVFPEIRGTVDFADVTRWPLALPWTRPGFYRQNARLRAVLDPRARLQLAGDFVGGVGQHSAIASGQRAADHLVAAR